MSNHYHNLAVSLRARSRLREAAEATRERIKLCPTNPTEIYNAARGFALCVPIEEDMTRKEVLATEAVQTLRAAMAAGWCDAAQTARNPDLAALHDRPDFQACLDDLFDRAFPSDPFAQRTKRVSQPPVVRPRQ